MGPPHIPEKFRKKKEQQRAVNKILVAFLLDHPVSDLGNPDCLDFQVSWNKNPKNDKSVLFKGTLFACFWALNDRSY